MSHAIRGRIASFRCLEGLDVISWCPLHWQGPCVRLHCACPKVWSNIFGRHELGEVPSRPTALQAAHFALVTLSYPSCSVSFSEICDFNRLQFFWYRFDIIDILLCSVSCVTGSWDLGCRKWAEMFLDCCSFLKIWPMRIQWFVFCLGLGHWCGKVWCFHLVLGYTAASGEKV